MAEMKRKSVTVIFDTRDGMLFPFQVRDNDRGEILDKVAEVHLDILGSHLTPPASGLLGLQDRYRITGRRYVPVDVWFEVQRAETS